MCVRVLDCEVAYLDKKLEQERSKLNKLVEKCLKEGRTLGEDEAVVRQSKKLDRMMRERREQER